LFLLVRHHHIIITLAASVRSLLPRHNACKTPLFSRGHARAGRTPPAASSLSEEVTRAIRHACVCGTLLCLGTAACDWLASADAMAYLERVQTAQLSRMRMRSRLEETLDELMFAPRPAPASAVALACP